MAKRTQKIRRLLPKNCLSEFEQFVGLALKGLTIMSIISFVLIIIILINLKKY